MKQLSFERHVSHTPEAMFDLVADLKAYPRFLPNCTAMEVKPEPDGGQLARMTIGFGPITQSYTSRVGLDRPERITAKALDGPFAWLDSAWTFEPEGEGTRIGFTVDFKISNPMLRAVAEPAFAAKQEEIVDAFLREAERRYGRPA